MIPMCGITLRCAECVRLAQMYRRSCQTHEEMSKYLPEVDTRKNMWRYLWRHTIQSHPPEYTIRMAMTFLDWVHCEQCNAPISTTYMYDFYKICHRCGSRP